MPLFRRKSPASAPEQPAPPRSIDPVVAITEADLQSALLTLSSGTRDDLLTRSRPAVRFATARLSNGRGAATGASKLGGLPDLAVGSAWPSWVPRNTGGEARPLAFFAQIDLAALSRSLDLPLPADGLLQFWSDFDFSGFSAGITGLYEDELAGARVTHVPAGSTLQRAEAPEGVEMLPEAMVAPLLILTVPLPTDAADEDYDAFDAAQQRLREQTAAAAPAGFAVTGAHQLGGHADYIQHPVEQEVVQAAYDVLKRSGRFDQERWQEVEERVAEWSMLFQFDSDDELELMFGDVGTLWWAAPTADVAAGRWEGARFNFQCS